MTIRIKLLLTVIPPIILGIFILGVLSSNLVKTNIVDKHKELVSLYSERLIQEHIKRRVDLLRSTGLYKVPLYVESYKKESLKDLEKETKTADIKVFIFDKEKMLQGGLPLPPLTNHEFWIDEIIKLKIDNLKDIIKYTKKDNIGFFYRYYYFESWQWHIVIYESDEKINEFINKIENIVFSVMILIALIVSALIYLVTNKTILKSIYKLQEVASQIAKGNLDYKVDLDTKDEIGKVANEFEVMRSKLKNRINLFNEQLHFRQLLIDAINIPIYIKDKNLEFISCNNAYLNLIGVDNAYGDIFSDSKLNQEFLLIESQALEDKNDKSKNLTIKDTKGDIKDIVLTNNLFYDTDNKVAGIVGSIFDISQINEAKKKIEKFNMELQVRVDEQTKELKQSNEELENSIKELKLTQHELIEAEKMASLGGLVAGIAHEINTPIGIGLTGITHFDELLKDIEKKYNNENMTEEGFKEFLSSSKTLSNLIKINLTRTAQLIKSFKQISVDQSSEQQREFDLKEYIDEIITSLYNVIKHTKIELKIDCDSKIFIKSYPGAISQIISNLIFNSINHAFEKDQKGIIEIQLFKDEDSVKIIYKDNGKGIAKENLSKIYEPFFTTKRNKGGTGLGLNIIYNLINKKFDGSISCTSEIEKGVEFDIVLKNVEFL